MGVHMDGETVNNLRFADDIDLIAESLQDLQQITVARVVKDLVSGQMTTQNERHDNREEL